MIETLTLRYTADKDAMSGSSATVLPWVRTGALIEGVTANIKRHQKDYNGSVLAERQFEKLVTQMIGTEAAREGSSRMKMASRYTRHRRQRW